MNFEFYDIMKLIDLFKNKRGKKYGTLYIIRFNFFVISLFFGNL